MRPAKRLARRLLVLIPVLALSACAGVIDRCKEGLNPPPGGWAHHDQR